MHLDQNDIDRNMKQFHMYALRTLHFAALAANSERRRRAKKEIPFSDLPASTCKQFSAVDSDFAKDSIFKVLDYDIVVQDDELADRLGALSNHFRDILLLKYFLGWTDGRIGALYGQHHFTIRHRRLTALKRLREIYEQNDK